MTVPSSEGAVRRLRSEERGAILALVALLGLVIVGLVGTVIDFGLGYVDKARLSRAVDAGVLAGARSLRSGEDVAREQALALAQANGASAVAGASLKVVVFFTDGRPTAFRDQIGRQDRIMAMNQTMPLSTLGGY